MLTTFPCSGGGRYFAVYGRMPDVKLTQASLSLRLKAAADVAWAHEPPQAVGLIPLSHAAILTEAINARQ